VIELEEKPLIMSPNYTDQNTNLYM
jgi:hypothetical protein